MAGNPLVDQGTLNRLRGSAVWQDLPNLNITAPYLGKEGMRLALEGESTQFIETMTGAVTSPQPYMAVSLTLSLLRTQSLADLYKQRMELDARIGAGTIRSDSAFLGVYDLVNCSIQSVRELPFNGEDAGFNVTIKGYYNINSALWN